MNAALTHDHYRTFDMGMWGWDTLVDPTYILDAMTCSQWYDNSDSGYCNATYEKLYHQQLAETNLKARRAIVYRMQRMVFHDRPYIVTNYVRSMEAWSSKWSDVLEGPDGWFSALLGSAPADDPAELIGHLNARQSSDDLFVGGSSTSAVRASMPLMGIATVFVNATEQREVAAGQTVFAEGEAGQEMFGLISGAIELRKGDRTARILEPGDTFGEMAIVGDAPRSLTAVATETSVLAVIDERAFLFLVHETPMFAIQVMRSMAERIRELDELG